ncbi:hypothetical protein [Stenotrophomonas sp. Iso1]|uniref:hypothetical protein n=1 Tax=Stenotrophomonas sp. Iso1 TaxID=2977283 RepID=UPI0022B7B8A1|nr:hypothetical protein [Stenotrophomonas sp. Iso1]
MAKALARTSATSSIKAPKLMELAAIGPGEYRLSWHGAISSGRLEFPLNFQIEVQFANTADPKNVHNLTLPLGVFPHLAVGTLWTDGIYSGHQSHEVAPFEVTVQSGKKLRWIPYRLSDLVPDYLSSEHGLAGSAYCFLVRTTEGDELVVPVAEILRAWYFFDSNVIPAVMAGAITNPHVLSHRHLPWIFQASCLLPGGGARIVHKNRLTASSAKCLARLLFDDVARTRTKEISHAIRGQLGTTSLAIPLPAVMPPFYGPAKWMVRCQQVSSLGSAHPRFLVHQLLASDDNVPYEPLQRCTETDLRTGETISEELKTIYQKVTENIFNDDSIELYGGGIDETLNSVQVSGLAFGNSALKVRTVIPPKDIQTHKGAWIDDGNVRVDQAGVDPTAPDQAGVPPASQTNTADDEVIAPEKIVHEIEIGPLFAEVLAQVCAHPELRGQGWQDDFPFGQCTININHFKSDTPRGFIIGRLTNGIRSIYLLDAETFRSEAFRLVAFEMKNGATLSEYRLRTWLGGFPSSPGCRWSNSESDSMGIAFERMNHQGPSDTPERTRELFKFRLVNRLLDMIMA